MAGRSATHPRGRPPAPGRTDGGGGGRAPRRSSCSRAVGARGRVAAPGDPPGSAPPSRAPCQRTTRGFCPLRSPPPPPPGDEYRAAWQWIRRGMPWPLHCRGEWHQLYTYITYPLAQRSIHWGCTRCLTALYTGGPDPAVFTGARRCTGGGGCAQSNISRRIRPPGGPHVHTQRVHM